jgi:hypothetical protein
VGSEAPFKFNAEEIKKRTMELNKRGVELPFVLSRGPEQVREIVKQRLDIPLNTDDRPVLEFHAARNLITGVQN